MSVKWWKTVTCTIRQKSETAAWCSSQQFTVHTVSPLTSSTTRAFYVRHSTRPDYRKQYLNSNTLYTSIFHRLTANLSKTMIFLAVRWFWRIIHIYIFLLLSPRRQQHDWSKNVDGNYTIKITYLLTYSMVQSPPWEANWFAASQEILRISRNPKLHYRTHKRPPPVSILGQPNPVHIPTSHLLKIHANIIHPSTPRSPQWSPSLRYPHQDPIHLPLFTHTSHMPSPAHSSRSYHPQNIGWGVQII